MSKKNKEFSWDEGITQKEYFETILKELRLDCKEKFKDLDRRTKIQFNSRDKALKLHSDSLNIRLDGLNEWRQQNKEEREQYLSRFEYEAKHQLLENKIDALQKMMFIALGAILAVDYIIKFFK